MTWVIGGMIPFGYGVAISDIRVTFSDGTHRDCLQKVYPVGNFIVAGFAGSVKIGFYLLQDLTNFLRIEEVDKAWIPEWVAINWWRRARKIYNNFPEEERKLGASILTIGIHPTKNNGDSPWPSGSTYIFECPKFEPKSTKGIEFTSIGSGKYIERYKKVLHSATQLHNNPIIQAEVGNIGGWGHAIVISLTHTIRENHDPTVSQHLHIAIAQRGQLQLGNNNYKTFTKEGEEKLEMPWVAKTYDEFIDYCNGKKVEGALATC